ncbi:MULTISPECIES: hypothetical protein [Tsukamurella]|uniref:Uncharacterized protein n=2 Tax=Tsukamurella TaxID=2060 RepID=A0A5C5RYU5_9ACTN|nr:MULTISPECIES: hypothetical protein [Tsukamurella]NMD56719.1 hypothetical protein [Tsukamurella columbiensis]TWS27385.1 hypothetical protein FK530_18855 [Tsukamurella conjunctivitidis]
MTRVQMGPSASRWWIAYLLVFGGALLGAVMDRRWGSAALVTAILLVGLVTTAGSLAVQVAVHVVACAFAAASAVIALVGHDVFWSIFGVLAALVLAALVPLARREGSGGRVRTEELVGRPVQEAERLLGYPRNVQPGSLGLPVLVRVPFDPGPDGADRRAGLVVTAVAVDPAGPWIAFGVAPAAFAPALVRRTRDVLQAELHARVGGFPADLRPERPGAAMTRSPRTPHAGAAHVPGARSRA